MVPRGHFAQRCRMSLSTCCCLQNIPPTGFRVTSMKSICSFALAIVLTLQPVWSGCAPLATPQSEIRVTEWPKNIRADLRGTSIKIALPENAPDRQWDDALIAKFEDLTGIHVDIVRPGNDTTAVLAAYLREFATGAPKADVYAIDIV